MYNVLSGGAKSTEDWRKKNGYQTAIPAAELTLCKTPGWLPSENIE